MAKTFAQLDIPFPLFEGPSDQTDDYCGRGTCSLCGSKRQQCFQLEIGCAVMCDCPKCGTVNGLDTSDREDSPCRQCKKRVPFPEMGEDEIKVCYACLRSGKAAITKDTELGMVSWEQAFAGVTHDGARLPRKIMFELLRTPTYSSIQGERWQICCRRPMVFVGEWSRKEFSRRAPHGNGRRFFEEIVQDSVPGLWEDKLHDVTGVYVFRCPSCERLTAHWDIA